MSVLLSSISRRFIVMLAFCVALLVVVWSMNPIDMNSISVPKVPSFGSGDSKPAVSPDVEKEASPPAEDVPTSNTEPDAPEDAPEAPVNEAEDVVDPETAHDQTLNQDGSKEDISGEDAPKEDVSGEDAPVGDAPQDDISGEDAPQGDAPQDDISGEDAPKKVVPGEVLPGQDAPKQDFPEDSTPIDPQHGVRPSEFPKEGLAKDPSWLETSGPDSEDEMAVPSPVPSPDGLTLGTPEDSEYNLTESETTAVGGVKKSKLHYLIPASKATLPFCASLVSVLANRYSVPTMVGFKGTGQYDAKAAHIAKLRSFARYLHGPAGADPDDLVIIQDGFDALAQLPAEFMIERYFELMADADKRLADSYGLTVEEAHKNGLRQTLLWGADKGCWPGLYDEPQCWGNPPSSLARNFYGPKTGNGDLTFNDPVYLNSGSVIGPLGDLRDLIDASLKLINETYSNDFKFRNSDQYYLSKLYVRQEIHRAKEINGNNFPNYGAGRVIPKGWWSDNSTQTDFHVAIDYQSAFTVTQCGNDMWMRRIQFNNPDHTAFYKEDVLGEGKTFKPWPIQMPASLFQAFKRIHTSVVSQMHQKIASQWIASIKLGTHTRSKQIFAFYHNTCSKEHFVDKYRTYWYYAMAKRLLVAATKAINAKEPITSRLIDGREWITADPYPENLEDNFGGVYTDSQTGVEQFIPFMELCGEHIDLILPSEADAPEAPPEPAA